MIRSRTAQLRIIGLLFIPMLVCVVRAPAVNIPLTLMAFAVLAIGVIALFRASEPPLMMLVVVYQWLQTSTKVIHADILGVPLNDMLIEGSFGAGHPSMGALGQATALSLLGLLALIFGLALGQRHRLGMVPEEHASPAASRGAPVRSRVVLATAAVIIFTNLLKNLQFLLPGGLVQILLPLIDIKWAFVFTLACTVLRDRKGYSWLVLICAMEILLGFTAYFSAWKEVILILSLAYFYCRPNFDVKRIVSGFGIFALGFCLAVLWTAIKTEQRGFLNRDTGRQIIERGTAESLANAFDLAAATDLAGYSDAVDKLARRIAYVDFFSNVLIHVPAVRDHEYGALWGTAIMHILTPRILFPGKPPLQSDSELTMVYTGLILASNYEGTSISLGYMAESYIDFGPTGMHVPIFFWGLFLGFSIRFLINRFGRYDLVWGMAIVVALKSLIFEMATVKLVGGTCMSLIVIFLALRATSSWLIPYLHGRSKAA